jgi:hypothetical protein
MRVSRRSILMAPFMAAGALLWPHVKSHAAAADSGRPLWPGARYTFRDRAHAIRRGMEFIYRSATDTKNFTEQGDDYLWCFYSTAATAADPALRRQAWWMGRERARRWRREHPDVPAGADADNILALVSGSYSVDCLRFHDPAMKDKLRAAARRFRPEDFFRFDPAKQPVPIDIPKKCDQCEGTNLPAARQCRDCGAALKMTSPYDILCDALITTYFGDRYGVQLGASLAEVTQWIPRLRPYPRFDSALGEGFNDLATAITHIVYTLNDYGKYRLRPEWLPDEFAFLKSHLKLPIAVDDAELMGEFLDTLKSFGLTEADPLIQTGVEFVMSRQNADGGWGHANSTDVYHRYHATWTAVNGLMDYAFSGESVSFPEALRRARSASSQPAMPL